MEAQTIARACGKAHVLHLEPEDLVAVTIEAAAMARVPLAGTDWIPGARSERDRRRRHRRRRHRGRRRGLGADPTRRHRCRCGRTQYRRLRDDGQVQRHRALPLRRQLAGRDGRPSAWRCSRRPRRSSAPTSGSGRPATSSASASPTSSPCAKALPHNGPSACRPRRSTRAEVARMWPFADLTPFAAFGWEARGGYGDAYHDRAGVRRLGAGRRRPGPSGHHGHRAAGRRRPGRPACGSPTAREISAGTVVVATGVWTKPFLAPYGIDVPIRVVREQIVTIAPGVEIGQRAGVLRPGVAAVRPPRSRRRHPVRQQRPVRRRGRRPRRLPQPRHRGVRRPHRREGRHPVPRLRRRGDPQPATPAATTSPRTGTR